MTEEKKVVAVPVVSGPVVSQAVPAPAEPSAVTVPTPADVPIPLSQVPSAGWSAVNLPRSG